MVLHKSQPSVEASLSPPQQLACFPSLAPQLIVTSGSPCCWGHTALSGTPFLLLSS